MTDDERPTLLVIGSHDPIAADLEHALLRHKMLVERSSVEKSATAALTAAPDLIVLLGDAATSHSEVIGALTSSALTDRIPVALVAGDITLTQQLDALRSGLAIVPRMASTDAIASRLAELARDTSWKEHGIGGEASLLEVVDLVQDALQVRDKRARVTLRPGVDGAIRDFVQRLKPLVDTTPIAEAFVSGDEPVSNNTLLLGGLRIMVIEDDPSIADELAGALRKRGARVVVVSVAGRGLAKARALNPSLVLLGQSNLRGAEPLMRQVRQDLWLRWASIIVVDLEVLLPEGGRVHIELLTGRLGPMLEQDEYLESLARDEATFETQLELTGPSRLLRPLANVGKTFHVHVAATTAAIDLEVAEGVIVSARATLASDDTVLNGPAAVAALMVLTKGEVTVERIAEPTQSNLVMSVDDAVVALAEDVDLSVAEAPRGAVSLPRTQPDYAAGSDPNADSHEPRARRATPLMLNPVEAQAEADEDRRSRYELAAAVAGTVVLFTVLGTLTLSGETDAQVDMDLTATSTPVVAPPEPIPTGVATPPAAMVAAMTKAATRPTMSTAMAAMVVVDNDDPANTNTPSNTEQAAATVESRRERVDRLIAEARQLRKRRAFRDSRARYEEAHEISPRSGKVLTGLARLEIATRHGDAAVRWTSELIRRYPRAANYVLHGDALKAAGDREGARRAWEHALLRSPRHPVARRRLGITD